MVLNAPGRERVCTTFAAGFGPRRGPEKKVKVKDPVIEEEVTPCLCDSGKEYGSCCQPYHKEKSYPSDPETLMRSRYTAFCKGQLQYLIDTTHPQHLELAEKTELELKDDYNLSCKNIAYEGLKVLSSEDGESEDEAFVTFRIWYRFVASFEGKRGGKTRKATEKSDRKTNTEKSRFKKVNGRWLFIESVESDQTSFRLGDDSEVSNDVLLRGKDAASKALNMAAKARQQFGFKAKQ